MRKLLVLLSMLVVMFTVITAPSQAEALPRSWRNTTMVTQHGVTYRIRKSDKAAVVVKTNGKRVCIPSTVKHDGKTYKVRNIWTTALKGAKVIRLEANLEGCDCRRLWKVKVYVTQKDMYKWLSKTGANVHLV